MASFVWITVLVFLCTGTTCLQLSGNLPDGQVVHACAGSDITLPWTVHQENQDVITAMQWYFDGLSQEMITMLSHDVFLPLPAFSQRVERLSDGTLVLRHVTKQDSGNYTIEVNGHDVNGSPVTLRHTINVQVAENLMTSDHQLHVTQSPRAVSNDVTGEWSLQLSCGHFAYAGQPPLTVEWMSPSGSRYNSSSYGEGQFHWLVPNPVEGSSYTCLVPSRYGDVLCLPPGSFQGLQATVIVDDLKVRLMLVEAEQSSLRAHTTQPVSDNTNLTSDVRRLEADIGQLTADSRQLTADNTQIAVEIGQLTEENRQLTTDNKNMTANLREMTAAIGQLTDDNRQLTEDNRQLTADNQRLVQNVTSLQSEVTQLNSDSQVILTMVTTDSTDMTADIRQLTEDNQNLTADVRQLTADNTQISADFGQLTADNQRLAQNVSSLQREVTQLKTDSQLIAMATDTHVSFQAGLTSNAYLLDHDHEHLILDKVISNHGNAYNSTTGEFIAPYDGTYFFIVTVGSLSTSQNADVLLKVKHSGNIHENNYNNLCLANADPGDTAKPGMATCHAVQHLKQGRRVSFRTKSTGGFDSRYTFFSGFLIST